MRQHSVILAWLLAALACASPDKFRPRRYESIGKALHVDKRTSLLTCTRKTMELEYTRQHANVRCPRGIRLSFDVQPV